MEIKRFSVHNDSRESQVAEGIRIIDAVLEPLKVLKILIEGLGADVTTGIWLTHFKGIPVARTISPFDLIYMDKDYRVVHAVALSTDSDFAPFKGMPESALVLPPQSIAQSNTRQGDQFIISLDHAPQTEAPRVPIPSPAAPVTQGAKSLRDLSPVKHFPTSTFTPPTTSNADSPLENFIASHSMPPRPRPAAAPLAEAPPLQNSATVPVAPRNDLHAPPPTPLPSAPSIPAAPSPKQPSYRADQSSRIPKRRLPAEPDRVQPPQVASAPTLPSRSATPHSQITPAPLPAPPATPQTFAAQLEAKLSQAVPKPKEQPPQKPVQPAQRLGAFPERRRMPQPPAAVAKPNQPPPIQPRIPAPRPAASAPLPTGSAKLPPLAPDRFVPPRRPQFEPPLPFTNYEGVTTEAKEPESKAKKLLRWALPGLNLFEPPPKPSDRRRAGRLPTPGLVAYFFTGGAPKPHKIENISVTGFYLTTNERWIPGTIIRMTLQRIGSTGFDPLDSITVHSRVIRWGAHGGGFEFVLSGFLD